MLRDMDKDADAWLRAHGLEQYCDVFRENDVDMRALPYLSEEDLRELGLSLGHRRVFMAALKDDAPPPPPPKPEQIKPDTNEEPRSSDAEHRHLSVIFVDIERSTELAEQLDPEDMRDLLKEYQDAVAVEVTRYGGQIAKFMGDGVLAHFGWPTAFEDHAERAVRSGLGILEAIKSLPRRAAIPNGLRIGVASGGVVVGDLVGAQTREDDALVGSVVNLAARIQTEARTNSVALSDETRKLTGQAFNLEDMGVRALKGFEKPQKVWLVSGERFLETRFEATRGAAETPLVGRYA
ncbi:MAG: adenylate/guanylate cyclase domain-containing protein, partial [Arenibacterium sp.]